jgi:hypothetical protein
MSSNTICPSRAEQLPEFAIGPVVLKRFVDGAEKPPFYQKRAPDNHPDWLRTVTLSFPSGRTAEEIVVDDAAGPRRGSSTSGCIELHPHAVRTNDLDHPDELRVDLDPIPGVEWDAVRKVAMEAKNLFEGDGARRLAEDEWLAGNARQRAHPAAMELYGSETRGARILARDRATRPESSRHRNGGKKNDTEFSSTTIRTRRIEQRARRTRFVRFLTRVCRRR